MMNNQPPVKGKNMDEIKAVLRHMGKVMIHNWPMKAACIVMAVLLWGTLMSQDESLTRTKVFENVAVSVANQSTLQRNGFIVVGGLEKISNVRVTAEVPQNYYDAAAASSYNVRVDLSQIDRTGEVEVPVNHTRHALYGEVTDLSLEQVTLQVEEYLSRSRIPVKIKIEGDMPQGIYGSASNIMVDPEYVSIAGPRSKVQSVVRCVAVYDLAALSGDEGLERTACSFYLEDATGKRVDMSNISVTLNGTTIDTVIAEQNLYKTVELPLDPAVLIKGEAAEGYRVSKVTVSPENIVMAVRDASSFTGDLKYLEGAVDVTDLAEDTTAVLTIIRPGDVINMNSDVAYVTVEIEKIDDSEGTK